MNAKVKSHEKEDIRKDHSEFLETVTKNIERLRKEKKITQEKLSEKIATLFSDSTLSEQSIVSKIINGKIILKAYDLYQIATALAVSVEDIIGESDSSSSNSEFNNTVIANIRKLMSLSTPVISEKELGEKVGLNEYEIGKCMGGSDSFNLEQISKIADYFSVSVDYLLGRKVHSNIEICSILSELIEIRALEVETIFKKEISYIPKYMVGLELPAKLKCIVDTYEKCRCCSSYPKIEGYNFSFWGVLPIRCYDECPFVPRSRLFQYLDKETKTNDYLAFYFPMYDTIEKDGNFVPNKTKNEHAAFVEGALNFNNLIINNFLKKYTRALNDFKESMDRKEFDSQVKSLLTEVVKSSLKRPKSCDVVHHLLDCR